jgi:hypothetical protein
MWMLREIERIHLHNCYNIPDYTFMDYNISDITIANMLRKSIDIPLSKLSIYCWKTLLKARLQSWALFAEISGAESLGEIGAGA